MHIYTHMLMHILICLLTGLEQFSKEPEDIRVTVGELARFECFIQGTPDPEITWEKHRQPLQENERYILDNIIYAHNTI